MEENVLKLKKLNAAWMAAQEFDYCPSRKSLKKIKELYNVGITDEQLKDTLDDNQGCRPDEISNKISRLIMNL